MNDRVIVEPYLEEILERIGMKDQYEFIFNPYEDVINVTVLMAKKIEMLANKLEEENV